MIITISGLPGSGKSTVAKSVAKNLGYKHYSTGDLQRDIATEHDLTITQLGEKEASDDKWDKMIDNKTKELGEEKDKIVLDTWLGAFFIPNAVKVYLECDENQRAKRRLTHKRKTESFDSIRETIKDMRQRVETNQDRWINYYDFDILDLSNYDIVIDTTNLTPKQVVDEVLDYVKTVHD
ncbi:MAG: putative adenylate kinase [Candidatus Woesearchaeota archaeon]|nr:putative adenylate kinase [Candidatus Woesearchaeota archaeon]